MMREEMDRLHQEQRAVKERRRESDRQVAHLDKAINFKCRIQALAKKLSRGLENMDFQQRREILRLLVCEVTYDDTGQVTIKEIISVNKCLLHPIIGDIRR
jgi:response regulator of citrate/malate metabolism